MPAKEQWRDSIRPRIETARGTLRERDLDDLVRSSGATYDKGSLVLSLFATPLRISVPEFEVQSAEEVPCREKTQILVLDYLTRASTAAPRDATTPATSNRWIGFQELPDGAFYAKAFRSYTSDVLLSALDGDIDRFRHTCACFAGETFQFGDAAAEFRALPNIRLAVVWWAGDDEFPATANVLFDSVASYALPIDGLAVLGRLLCRGLVSADTDK